MDALEPHLQQVLQFLPPELQEKVKQPEILIAVLVVLVTIVLFALSRAFSGGKKGSTVVLVGPCNSGKTTLFYQLKDGSCHNGTVASMQENEGAADIKNDKGKVAASVKLLDIPGHERLRHKLDQGLKEASAILFVVDAVDITPHKVEAAEELFEVLTHPSIAKRKVPVLLACNKMDLEAEAHSVEFIRRTIEKQLDSMRKTRTSLSPEAAAKAAVLGKSDKPFSLAGLRNSITTASISAKTGDIKEVLSFLLSQRL